MARKEGWLLQWGRIGLSAALAAWFGGMGAFAAEAAAEKDGPAATVAAEAGATAAAGESAPAQPGNASEPQRIIVTATRIPAAEGTIADSVTVFTADQMAERQYRTVDEALRYTPGVQVDSMGGSGTLTTVRIRGMDSGRTVLLMDGMPMNDPSSIDGSFDFAGFSLDNVAQLEVLRGPQSTLYGSNASGGVVNMTSKKGSGPFSGYISAEGGSRGTAMTRIGSSAGTDKVDYSFAGSLQHTDGFSSYNKDRGFNERDGYDQGTFSLRLGANPTDGLRFDLFSFASKSKVEFDDTDDLFNPYEEGIATKLERYMVRPQVSLSLFDGRWEQKAGVGYMQTKRNQEHPFSFNMSRNEYLGDVAKFDYQSIFHLNSVNTILAGVDVLSESMRYNDPFYGANGKFNSGSVTHVGIYLEDQINFRDAFFLTAGVRQEHHDSFGGKTTWKGSAMYVFPTRTKLKASAGTGFKAPDLYRLYVGAPNNPWGPTRPNPNLKPETSFGWDAGFEQAFGEDDRLTFGGTYFFNRVKNKIDTDFVNSTYRNIAGYESWGVEAFVRYAFTESIVLNANYTWLRERDSANPGSLTIQMRRPLHEFSVNLDGKFLEKGTFTAGVRYTGRRWDVENFAPWGTVRMPSYVVARVGAAWKFTENIEIFGRVENLLDKKYEAVNGFGTAPISFFAGATLSF